MNKIKLLFCLILAFCIVAGAVIYKNYLQKPNTVNREFVWGISAPVYQPNGYSDQTAEKEIRLLDELGVSAVRVFLERSVSLNPLTFSFDEVANDGFIKKLNQHNKDVLLILDGDIINSIDIPNFDYESAGYKLGSYAAKRYKGQVKYYQLANELTGTIVKPSDPNFDGATFDGEYGLKYSIDRYKATLGWTKGIAKGIKDGDPNAKTVVTGHWILYDIITKVMKDGLDFDVLGWAWYSADGRSISTREIDGREPIDLAKKLEELGKPVWIIESNYDHGSYDKLTNDGSNESKQADYIYKTAKDIYDNGLLNGYFVYTLFDDLGNKDIMSRYWGICGYKVKNDGTYEPIKKAAFDKYKEVIHQPND